MIDGNWWLRQKAKHEKLNLLPPALVLKREVEKRMEAIMKLECEQEVREAVVQLNQFIEKSNQAIVWGPASDVTEYCLDGIIAQYRNSQNS